MFQSTFEVMRLVPAPPSLGQTANTTNTTVGPEDGSSNPAESSSSDSPMAVIVVIAVLFAIVFVVIGVVLARRRLAGYAQPLVCVEQLSFVLSRVLRRAGRAFLHAFQFPCGHTLVCNTRRILRTMSRPVVGRRQDSAS